MRQLENYDDDNLIQMEGDTIALINYDNDTVFLINHLDTVIEDKHIVIDTMIKNDTVIIERQTFDTEIKIIEKLLDRPDFGKSAVSILIFVFVIYSIVKKWNIKK